MIALLGIAGVGGAVIIAAMLRGWVLSVMWMWFVVPTFGLTPLSIPVAIGIGLILSFTTHQTNISAKPKRDISDIASSAVGYPLVLLGLAWIVKSFM